MRLRPERFELPDLLLRRLSNQPWSTRNQAVTVALEWPYTALLALTEHILHTASVEIAVASPNEDFSRTTLGALKPLQRPTPTDSGKLLQNPQPPRNQEEVLSPGNPAIGEGDAPTAGDSPPTLPFKREL
jgi:hypothetical protein